MSLHIHYLEDVKGIRFAISFCGNPQNPITSAEDSLIKANLEELGIKIEPSLSTFSSSAPFDFKMSTHSSTNLCYVVKADSFSSIEDIKSRVLKGFTQHVSKSPSDFFPKDMEYIFEEEYSKLPNRAEEKLRAYLESRSKRTDVDIVSPVNTSSAVASSSSASFFNRQTSPPAPNIVEQKPIQGPCCTIL